MKSTGAWIAVSFLLAFCAEPSLALNPDDLKLIAPQPAVTGNIDPCFSP